MTVTRVIRDLNNRFSGWRCVNYAMSSNHKQDERVIIITRMSILYKMMRVTKSTMAYCVSSKKTRKLNNAK